VIARGVDFARRIGDRDWEGQMRGGEISTLVLLGRWEEALLRPSELEASGFSNPDSQLFALHLIDVDVSHGQVGQARARLEAVTASHNTEDMQVRATIALYEGVVLRAEGKPRDALNAIERELPRVLDELGVTFLTAKLMIAEALECAFELGDLARVEELLGEIERLRPGERPPLLTAHAARFRAKISGDSGSAEKGFRHAAEIFGDHELVFWLAVTQLEHGEWLADHGRREEAEPLLAEASETFERLEATPWLERANGVLSGEPTPV
jgi:hypothetical protein